MKKHSTCNINNQETPLNKLLPQGHQEMLRAVYKCMAQANDIHNEIIEREMKISNVTLIRNISWEII